MYPMPVSRWRPANRLLYKVSLPFALLLWLLPLIAVLTTSIRSSDELSAGNYWGWPQHFALVENYRIALTQTPMLHYFMNSVLITLPAVAVSIFLASMAGHALANYRFRGNMLLLANRPLEAAEHKLKKADAAPLRLELTENPDIIAALAAQAKRPFLVGFAAETRELAQYAQDKLRRKGIDMIAANEVGGGKGFEVADNALHVYWRDGDDTLPDRPKAPDTTR